MQRLRRGNHPPATSNNQSNPACRKIVEKLCGPWGPDQICISNLLSSQEALSGVQLESLHHFSLPGNGHRPKQ